MHINITYYTIIIDTRYLLECKSIELYLLSIIFDWKVNKELVNNPFLEK